MSDMKGLTGKLYRDLRQALLACGPFDNPAELRAVFNVAELSAWRNQLPAGGDKQALVDETITLLYDNPYDHPNPLVRFLNVLADQEVSEGCRETLARLAGEISAYLGEEGVVAEESAGEAVSKPVGLNPVVTELQPGEKVLDAAIRNEVEVGKSYVVLVLIRDPESQSLRVLVNEEPDYNLQEDNVRSSGEFKIHFPMDESGKLLPTNVEIVIVAPDFDPEIQSDVIEVYPPEYTDEEPNPKEFYLRPLVPGELQISIHVYQLSEDKRKEIGRKPLRTLCLDNPSEIVKFRVISLIFQTTGVGAQSSQNITQHFGNITKVKVEGGGAAAVGEGSTAVGERGVNVGGNVQGGIITGDQNVVFNQQGQTVGGHQTNIGGDAHIGQIGDNINTGGGDYVRGDKTVQGDEVHGDKVTGDKVGGDQFNIGSVSGGAVAIGRGAQATQSNVQQGLSAGELAQLFMPLQQAVAQSATAGQQQVAVQNVQALQEEVAKGEEANDNRMANLIQDIADVAPGAVEALVGLFTSSVIAKLAGTTTQFVVGRLKR